MESCLDLVSGGVLARMEIQGVSSSINGDAFCQVGGGGTETIKILKP